MIPFGKGFAHCGQVLTRTGKLPSQSLQIFFLEILPQNKQCAGKQPLTKFMNVLNKFTFSPQDYRKSAHASGEANDALFERLEWMRIKPKVIVDLGCGIGDASTKLLKRYPGAQVIGIDREFAMVDASRLKQDRLCAEAKSLPFLDDTIDLIFANFLLPWEADWRLVLCECRRVLSVGGLLIFTALGPDTLREMRAYINNEETPFFIDMHDVGDLLMQAKFTEPVVETEYLTIVYRDPYQMLDEMIKSGMLSKANSLEVSAIPAQEKTWPITFELIYAHCFVPEKTQSMSSSQEGSSAISVDYLRTQLRSKV